MDSVSGLIDATALNSEVSTKTLISRNKFSNIEEVESIDSVAIVTTMTRNDRAQSNNKLNKSNTNFDYSNINNDNDNSDTNSRMPRTPITPIIKHYENIPDNSNKTRRSASPLSTNSITMKLEPHSPTRLKSFKNYDNTNDDQYNQINCSNVLPSPHHNHNHHQTNAKFNGKL